MKRKRNLPVYLVWIIGLVFVLPTPAALAGPHPGPKRELTGMAGGLCPPDLPAVALEADALSAIGQEVLVRFRPEVGQDVIEDVLSRYDLVVTSCIPALQAYLLETRSDEASFAAEALMIESTVEWAEPNYIAEAALHPNDPDYNDPTRVYAPQLVGAESAWDVTTGSPDVVVAVLDSGIAWGHPEFAGRIVQGKNILTNTPDSDAFHATQDNNGHGTHVAGILAAAINNGIGMVGIAPGVRVMPVKVLNASNIGTTANIAAGIVYAADSGARIINMSLATVAASNVLYDAVRYAAERGAVLVAAAGNAGGSIEFYPAAYPQTIAVGATTSADDHYVLSNFADYVDIAAPGEGIWSSLWTAGQPNGYGFLTGTSMAAPHVAGFAALLLTLRPDLTADNVRGLIERTAADLGDPGWDPHFGYGRIDVGAAMQALNALYLLRVNGGNGDYLDTQGLTWDKEQRWNNIWGFTDGGSKFSDKPVSGTEDDRLYQSWHEDPREYRFAVPDGVYQVTLRFAEFEVSEPGERIMRISMEGAVVEDALDLLAAAGRYAVLDQTYRVLVTDGILNIDFTRNGGSKKPIVSAIEIVSDLLVPTPLPALRRVVSWDRDYQDSRGLLWEREQKWDGTWGFMSGGRKSSDKPVSGTADAALYQRWHDDPRRYRFALPDGTYQVTLRFAEFETDKIGERVMKITIEGNVVEPALDVCAAVGRYAALDRVYQAAVADGELSIDFVQLGRKHPMISSIEVLPQP